MHKIYQQLKLNIDFSV